MGEDKLVKLKTQLPVKRKLPKYVYKQSTGSTFYVKIHGTYVGTFKTLAVAEAALLEVLSN